MQLRSRQWPGIPRGLQLPEDSAAAEREPRRIPEADVGAVWSREDAGRVGKCRWRADWEGGSVGAVALRLGGMEGG